MLINLKSNMRISLDIIEFFTYRMRVHINCIYSFHRLEINARLICFYINKIHRDNLGISFDVDGRHCCLLGCGASILPYR